jgi:hypothetical protein
MKSSGLAGTSQGMIRYKETAEDRIRATALEELGAEVVFEGAPLSSRSLNLSGGFAVTLLPSFTNAA